MYIDKMLRLVAGFMVLFSLTLALKVDIQWLWLTGFVGLNLLQSGFTNWCPLVSILKAVGMPEFPEQEPGHSKVCCNQGGCKSC